MHEILLSIVSPRDVIPSYVDEVSISAFYALNWVFFAICTIAFSLRVYIRFVCFRRLFFEDYLMLVALVLHTVEAIVIQLLVHHAYKIEAMSNGDLSGSTSPGLWGDIRKSAAAVGVTVNLTIVGELLVKINFLLFFRRLGTHLRWFIFLWWVVLLFTIGSTLAQIGVQRHQCNYRTREQIFGPSCTSRSAISEIYFDSVFSASIDAFSDLLIIGFPVAILWKSGISVRKKVALTFIFCLVFLTIAITIVRGTIFYGVSNKDSSYKVISPSFIIFWFYIEFSIAFIIACMVSFRTLFVHNERRTKGRLQEMKRRTNEQHTRHRAREWMDSVFDTCVTLEGLSDSEADKLCSQRFGLPQPSVGLMTVDFNDDDNWSKSVPKTAVTEAASSLRSALGDGHVLKPQTVHLSATQV